MTWLSFVIATTRGNLVNVNSVKLVNRSNNYTESNRVLLLAFATLLELSPWRMRGVAYRVSLASTYCRLLERACQYISWGLERQWLCICCVALSCCSGPHQTWSTMPADEELSSILNRRQAINEALDEGKPVTPQFKNVKKNIFSEFHEFSRREIKEYEKTFNRQVNCTWFTTLKSSLF